MTFKEFFLMQPLFFLLSSLSASPSLSLSLFFFFGNLNKPPDVCLMLEELKICII